MRRIALAALLALSVFVGPARPVRADGFGPLLQAQVFIEAASGTAIGASATFTGATRDVTGPGLSSPYVKCNAVVFPNSAGTLYIQQSNDNSGWFTTTQASANAGQTTVASSAVAARYCRVLFINGASAGSFAFLNASLTGS